MNSNANDRPRHVWSFPSARAIPPGDRRRLLGGKGAGLVEMTALGIPVPPGFVVTTEACALFHDAGGRIPAKLEEQVRGAMAELEEAHGRGFGDPARPLLVSVRSGAAVSMPGMMDTVLNLGLNEETLRGLEETTRNPRFAHDARRRFLQMFGQVVCGLPGEEFEEELAAVRRGHGAGQDAELPAEGMREAALRFLEVYRRHGVPVPDDPWTQLTMAAEAVFRSWDNERAVTYRRLHGIHGLVGTAVTVQAMVFGNTGPRSGSGVCFTRNPSTGEKVLYGEFLPDAQGEDVVAGIRTPLPVAEMEGHLPGAAAKLREVGDRLERHFRDMQDIEFTVEDGALHILQTRSGKRTGPAALRIAADAVREGLRKPAEALALVEPGHLDQLLHPTFDPRAPRKVVGKGLPASPGAAAGKICLTAEEAVEAAGRGEEAILVREETSPDDIAGMHASRGILTGRGGMTSHAAVVARGMGKPCVVGCPELRIDSRARTVHLGDAALRPGDEISLDGTTGEVMTGRLATVDPQAPPEFETVMQWADAERRLGVRANADTPEDCRKAVEMGAEGVGLCRTEHMFFGEGRLRAMQEMILAGDESGRRAALEKLLPMQRGDFLENFRVMRGRPVTIRLLDPPLHEFLPQDASSREEVARDMGVEAEDIARRVEALRETNPMLGHRGCRLGISYPEIYEMQVRAILEAAHAAAAEGVEVLPEIMVPLVGMAAELRRVRTLVERVAAEVERSRGGAVRFQVGTMIEVPRAALTAGEVARASDFFSFGTNDLTQTTFAFSRDDAGTFLPAYIQEGLLQEDPFRTVDEAGVGRLMRIAVEEGRAARKGLKVGICGESGGDPATVAFCHRIGLDYVSCSPFRVPVARLAAARAALEAREASALEPAGG